MFNAIVLLLGAAMCHWSERQAEKEDYEFRQRLAKRNREKFKEEYPKIKRQIDELMKIERNKNNV